MVYLVILFLSLRIWSAKMTSHDGTDYVDARYSSGLPIVGTTKCRQYWARSVHSKNTNNTPAVPAPMATSW